MRKSNGDKEFDKHCLALGKLILGIQASFGEAVTMTLIINEGKYQVVEAETVRGRLLNQKINTVDYDEEDIPEINTAFKRGIL